MTTILDLLSPCTPLDTTAEVVIVGGGPVGLATAIQLKGRKVVVVEKYPTYQRTDITLRVDAASMAGLALVDQELKAKVNEWGAKRVPISEIEGTLEQKAHDLGVTILKGVSVDDPSKLQSQFPNARVFVGADGARSLMREHICDDRYQFNVTHQHIINVHYKIEPAKPKKTKLIVEAYQKYRRIKFANYIIAENRKELPDGNFAINLQIFIDQATYDCMTDATFKKPYYFETDMEKIPDTLKDILIRWWGTEEGTILQDEDSKNKLTVIKLSSYLAKKTHQQSINPNTGEETLTVIVGDALAAFPFFRAINNGFLHSTKLVKCIEEGFQKNSFSAPMQSYSNYAFRRGVTELIKALAKSFMLTLSHVWIRASNLVPWNTIKLSRKAKAEALQKGTLVWETLTEPG